MPSPGVLEHAVAGIVDEVHVVARAAEHDVGTRSAVEEIVAGVAVEQVVVAVAVALQVGVALEDQGFHVRRQPEVSHREHRIDAFAGILDHLIADIVDEVDVVAGAAEHGVGPALTVEEIVARVACQRVGIAIAVSLQIRAARQGEVFDVLRQPVMRRRDHRVDALAGGFRHHVAGTVDDVGVVAEAPTIMSPPVPPSSVSLPPRPMSGWRSALPVMTLVTSLPVPLNAARRSGSGSRASAPSV